MIRRAHHERVMIEPLRSVQNVNRSMRFNWLQMFYWFRNKRCGHRHYAVGAPNGVVEPSLVLDMLGGRAAYRRFVQEGLKDGHREEYYDAIDQRFLGEERFVQKLKVQADEESAMLRSKRPISAAFRSAARALEVEPVMLSAADRGWKTSQCREPLLPTC
jgi:hypothetical protein